MYTQTAELTASDSAAYDDFGASVSLSGDGSTALVGAVGHNGAAYVCRPPCRPDGINYLREKGTAPYLSHL